MWRMAVDEREEDNKGKKMKREEDKREEDKGKKIKREKDEKRRR